MLIILWVRLLVTRWKWEVASNFTGKLPDELLKDKAPKGKKIMWVRMSDGQSFFIKVPGPARCMSGNCICPFFKRDSSCGQRDCDSYQAQYNSALVYKKLDKYLQAKAALNERLECLSHVFSK